MGANGKSLLVVDDEPDIRFLLRLTLEREGYVVNEAGTGEEALDMIEDGVVVDLVLLDLNLPNMNGFGVIRSLRHMGHIDPPAIFMITADADPELPERAIAAGFKGFILKGISPMELTRIVEEGLSSSG
jgi:two-component system chemotaxis response regulator CheY